MSSTASPTSEQTQERLRSLVVANRAIVAELSLDTLLRLVVESARTVVGAEYGVLEVIGTQGVPDQVVRSGTDPRPGHSGGGSPVGGLSEVVPGTSLPLRRLFRAPDAASEPDSRIRSLLGVAVGSSRRRYGNLFLANRSGVGEFSAEDESLVTALAATAGIAIENARLYTESQRRQEWLTASAEISQRLLTFDVDAVEVLGDIAATVQRLAPADTVSIVVPDPAKPAALKVAASCGQAAEQPGQVQYDVDGSIARRAMQTGRGVLAQDVAHDLDGLYFGVRPLVAVSHVMALPLRGADVVQGAIVVVRTGPVPFTATDVELAAGFAGQAALVQQLAASRRQQQQLAVLEDRARIARDLHDHVVQKLFAVGLNLQSAMRSVRDPLINRRLAAAVAELNQTIGSIRNSIHELQAAPKAATTAVRPRLAAVLSELAPVLGFEPDLHVELPFDTVVPGEVVEAMAAMLGEAVVNIALHAEASAASVRVVSDGRILTLSVSDDGGGLPEGTRLSGLAALRERAENRGGRLELVPSPRGGLLLTWSVPL
jgi:signal transduction histidine kinase